MVDVVEVEEFPALSVTSACTVWVPSEKVGRAAAQDPPSAEYSTVATPEVASLALTVIAGWLVYQPVGIGGSTRDSTGEVVSRLTVLVTTELELPALSVALE
jgi:hypothetical protein